MASTLVPAVATPAISMASDNNNPETTSITAIASTEPPSAPLPKRFLGLRRPPGYLLATLGMSLGGFLNGFDTGSIGGVTEMAPFVATLGPLSPAARGFAVSLSLLAGALPSLVAGQLADRHGRPQVVMAGALVFALGAAMQAAAGTMAVFLVGRALCGVGQGLWISNVSVYVTEIAPSARRGALVSLFQFQVTTGLTAGYFTCYGSRTLAPSALAWRVPYIVQSAVGVLLAIACIFAPMSPRWLMLRGRREQAVRAIERLDFSRAEAEKDFMRPQEGEQVVTALSAWQGLLLIFRRGYRTRTVLALFLLGMVQLCGIDGVLFYAPTLFKQAGLPSDSASFLASGVSAILITAVSVPACLFADKWSRRTSALLGGCTLSGCMLLIGSLYASDVVHPWGAARWVVVVSIFIFALTYAATWAVTGKIYASEIQPANTRAAANCVAQGLNFFTNWLVAITTPIFLAESSYGAYFLFGGLSLGTVAVLAMYMPETRGLSLESINDAFLHRPSPAKSWAHQIRRLYSSGATANVGQIGSGESVPLEERESTANSSGMAGRAPLRVMIGAV